MERYHEHDGNSSFWEAITSPCGSSAQLFQHAGGDGGANESGVPLSIRGGGGAMAAGCGINGGWYGHLGEFSKQIQIRLSPTIGPIKRGLFEVWVAVKQKN
jgi:hypothetical protein